MYRKALAWLEEGREVAAATVIATSGSTPRHLGAKMLVDARGDCHGTIGGGRVEHEVAQLSREVAAGAPTARVTHHLVRDLAMCCGGTMEFVVHRLVGSLGTIAEALALWDRRGAGALSTPLSAGALELQLLESHRARAPRLLGDRFVEPVWPRDRMILFGAGHLARAIGPISASLGFEVVLCDDNETGAVDDAPAWAGTVVPSFEVGDVVERVGTLGPGDFALIVTRDHAVDENILGQLLPNTALSYLGLIGSLGKVGRFRKRLEARGVATPERWERLRAPMGVDIAAETPEEIAVSIAAELVAHRRGALGGSTEGA